MVVLKYYPVLVEMNGCFSTHAGNDIFSSVAINGNDDRDTFLYIPIHDYKRLLAGKCL